MCCFLILSYIYKYIYIIILIYIIYTLNKSIYIYTYIRYVWLYDYKRHSTPVWCGIVWASMFHVQMDFDVMTGSSMWYLVPLLPISSMYGIFTNTWLTFMVNVGKYTIHGMYGLGIRYFLRWSSENHKNPNNRKNPFIMPISASSLSGTGIFR